MRIWIPRRTLAESPAALSETAAQRERRLYPLRLAVITACTLAAFTLPAVLVPWRGERIHTVVIAMLILTVAASGLGGGRTGGVLTAVMAGCSLDFFHDSTPQLLSLATAGFWKWTAIFVATGLFSATAAGARRATAGKHH